MDKRIVMVVEDDHLIRQVIAEALEEEGFEVMEAANGKEALEALEQVRPSLILLDLMMPVMDGWTFRGVQRNDPALADIPVVVVSASLPPGLKLEDLGAKAMLEKPFGIDLLAQTLAQVAAAA